MILVVYFLPEGIVPAVRAGGTAARRCRTADAGRPRKPRHERRRRRRAHGRRADDPLRRAHRRRRRLLRGARGRGALADRPQRRRQDHRLQRHHRLHRARRRARSAIAAHGSPASSPTRLPRSAWCARSRRPACSPARPCTTTCRSACTCARGSGRSPSSLGLPSVAREEARAGARSRRDPGLLSGWRRADTTSPPRCPTASCACSRLPSRWRRGRSCCCSTSRCPA